LSLNHEADLHHKALVSILCNCKRYYYSYIYRF